MRWEPLNIGSSPKEPMFNRPTGYYRLLTKTKSAMVRKKMRPIGFSPFFLFAVPVGFTA
jgi:hypothetical protein